MPRPQALHAEDCGQAGFKRLQGFPELFQQPGIVRFQGGALRIVIEHEFGEFRLGQQRRIPCGREDKISFIHGSPALEEAAALFIHGR